MRLRSIGLIAALVLALLAGPLLATAQQAETVHRIGYLADSKGRTEEAFQKGLRELGYVEGRNLVIEWRFGRKNRSKLAAELVRAEVDLIVTRGTGATRAAQNATSTIPIVMGGVGNAVSRGFVASLAKPGGNVTGLTTRSPDLADKRLELLKEILPNISRVGLLRNASRKGTIEHLRDAETAAGKLGLNLQSFELRGSEDAQNVLGTVEERRPEALVVVSAGIGTSRRAQIIAFATHKRLPIIASSSSWTRDGGLMSLSPNRSEQQRRASIYVDKILKGAKPADLPVERSQKFDLIVNLKAAKQIGVTVPSSLLYRADKVIN